MSITLAELKKLVAKYQKLLGLAHWDIKVEVATEPVEEYAKTTMPSSYDSATIAFNPVWPTYDEKTLCTTIIHELLHLHTRDIDQVVEDARSQLHPQASAQIEKRYDHEVEGLVDRLALRIYEMTSTT